MIRIGRHDLIKRKKKMELFHFLVKLNGYSKGRNKEEDLINLGLNKKERKKNFLQHFTVKAF